jgi:hypothetical protein
LTNLPPSEPNLMNRPQIHAATPRAALEFR